MATREHSITSGKVFAGLGRKGRRRLEELSAPVLITAGRTITAQGRRGDEFGVILDGTVSVFIDGEIVRTLGPGDHYGEIALLAEPGTATGPRTATLVAATDVTASVMSIREFDAFVREFPEISERLMAART